MTLPVSSYEELLVQVRELTNETILLQRQLSSDLFENPRSSDVNHNFSIIENNEKFHERHRRHGRDPFSNYNPEYGSPFCQSLESSTESVGRCLAPICCRVNSQGTATIYSRKDYHVWDVKTHRKEIVTSLDVVETPSATTPLRRVGSSSTSVSNAIAAAAYNPVAAALTRTSSLCPGSTKCIHPKLKNLILLEEKITDDSRSKLYWGLENNGITINEINNKEDVMEPEIKEEDERRSAASSPELYRGIRKRYNADESSEEEKLDYSMPASYRGTWPIRRDLWASQQMGFSVQPTSTGQNDMARGSSLLTNSETQGHRRLVTKVGVVYNLLDMLGGTEGPEDMSITLLSMSNSADNCLVMRQSGCLPLLVQLIHEPGQDAETRDRASQALHNVIHAKSDERTGRREARVLRFLQQLRDYCQALRISFKTGQHGDHDRHPGPTIAALMKLSFDESHRHAMCQLGGLHAVAELIEMDHLIHGSECEDHNFITLRRYAGMALTNLTFGDGKNKALLCSFREFMKALIAQLKNSSDDLRQVTASLLRNLSWRADSNSKKALREVGAVPGLMKAAMEVRKESTLKSILSALWNLSAHCSTNKVDICAVDGALGFIVDTLSYKAPSKTLTIIEHAGGILRNVSSHIAVRDDYRTIVRDKGCLQVLLQQLKSPSLTVVSNACGALWNLSARCGKDQRLLWDLGAVPMLRSLVHSKHKMISMGSSAALKNLLSARPGYNNLVHLDSTARGLGLTTLPTLVARRQKAFEQEIDPNLAETCDNIEPSTSPPNKDDKFTIKVDHSFLGINPRSLRSYPGTSKCVVRSESRESMRSVTSTHSDTMFEKVSRQVLNGTSQSDLQLKQQSSSLHSAVGFDNAILSDDPKSISSEKKYTIRYKNAIPEHLKGGDEFNKCTNSTMSWSSMQDRASNCSQGFLHSSIEDNFSSINPSIASTPKAHSQSSISEEVQTATLCTQSDYETASQMFTPSSSNSLSYANDNGGVKEASNYQYRAQSTVHQLDSLNDITNDYAETDLDQPTDYSLRYAECTTDEDDKQDSTYFTGSEQSFVHEDSIKTYCTEGTPRETSLNSSRAASATDLQDDGHKTTKNLYKRTLSKNNNEGSNKDHLSSLETSIDKPSDIKNVGENLDQVSDGDEDDEDLLTACINIGMQNNRHRHSFIGKTPQQPNHNNLFRYQTNMALDQVEPSIVPRQPSTKNELTLEESTKTTDSESSESFNSVEQSEHALLELCIQSGISKKNDDHLEASDNLGEKETLDKAKMNKETEIVEKIRRQKDPDAMIASLDRLTATLVQQTEAIRERDSMKQSTQSDTWNEDSPNELSFPSISMSAPLIPSFKSDIQEEEDLLTISERDIKSNDDLMTTSRMIEQEAMKLANAVDAEIELPSFSSMDLEAIRPPSSMGSLLSLTTSYAGPLELFTSLPIQNKNPIIDSSKNNIRKKSLPIGVVAKRALGQGSSYHATSLENLLNECTSSHLENVKPPSMMDEVFDMGDMENSMLSVASITSEIADSKDQDVHSSTGSDAVFDLLKPMANVLSLTCMRYAEMQNSLSECLENINPPSLFNEVSQMDESTMEITADTLCYEEDQLNTEEIPYPTIDEDESDNDSNVVVTPISSEYCTSSVESTPKKRLNLTPKQKRNLAKERFKTYTIAVEIIKKEQERKMHNNQETPMKKMNKLTPRQKRQEDRARFQTQVLDNPLSTQETPEQNTSNGSIKSSIPTLKKFIRPKENKERYRTRTLNDSESLLAGIDSKTDEIQSMLEHNATIVLNTLNETNVGDELLLDCETISLISNDSESERSLRVRFVNGLSKKLLNTSIQEPKSDSEDETKPTEEQYQEMKRPRIIKPNLSRDLSVESNLTDKSDPESPKAIRGRRKALYSNPITRKPTPQSSPSKQTIIPVSGIPIGRSHTSPIVRATRATTLRQNNNTPIAKDPSKFPMKTSDVDKKLRNPTRPSSFVLTKVNKKINGFSNDNTSESPVKPLERQGTFTKDEPEVENAPTVFVPSSPIRTKIAKPVRNIISSKIHPAVGKIKHPTYQSNVQRNQTSKCSTSSKRLPVGKLSVALKTNQSPKRSNSNSNIVPNSSIDVQSRKNCKEATSKIANLWKKVEENKLRQRFEKPDTRQWITPGEIDSTEQPTGFRLFRSSTFEGVTQGELNDQPTKQSNPMRYSNVINGNDAPCKIPIKLSDNISYKKDHVSLRRQKSADSSRNESDSPKRISRLGSFIQVDPSTIETDDQTLTRSNCIDINEINDQSSTRIVTASSKITNV